MDITHSVKMKLKEIEAEHKIKILYACESGSRAWGFSSINSDYDIRFVYQRTFRDYLALKEPANTIEFPIINDMDYSGWDLKKVNNR
jgi:uncharacterized protein